MSQSSSPDLSLPLRGAHNPSSTGAGTTPGSFANAPQVGSALTYSSPDTPGMPPPSDKTAWDFMPPDWTFVHGRWTPPEGFEPREEPVSVELRAFAHRAQPTDPRVERVP